jgi:hypothetical protein
MNVFPTCFLAISLSAMIQSRTGHDSPFAPPFLAINLHTGDDVRCHVAGSSGAAVHHGIDGTRVSRGIGDGYPPRLNHRLVGWMYVCMYVYIYIYIYIYVYILYVYKGSLVQCGPFSCVCCPVTGCSRTRRWAATRPTASKRSDTQAFA